MRRDRGGYKNVLSAAGKGATAPSTKAQVDLGKRLGLDLTGASMYDASKVLDNDWWARRESRVLTLIKERMIVIDGRVRHEEDSAQTGTVKSINVRSSQASVQWDKAIKKTKNGFHGMVPLRELWGIDKSAEPNTKKEET